MFTKSSIGVSIAVLSVAAVLSACVTPTTIRPDADPDISAGKARVQMESALEVQYKRAKRLSRVSWPLLTENLELCSDNQTYKLGISYDSLERHEDEDYFDILRDDYNVGLQPTILYVIPGSPADVAKMQEGDKITHMNGTKLGVGEDALEAFAEALKEHRGGNIDLKILRGSFPHEFTPHEFTVSPIRVCDYAVILKNWPRIGPGSTSPFADGRAVYITPGIMRFIQKDEELAFVIGRTLAQDSRGHTTARLINGAVGGIVGIAIGAAIGGVIGISIGADAEDYLADRGELLGKSAFSEEFEAEADYVGIYYVARANYDVSMATEILTRKAEEYPELIHPSAGTLPAAERFQFIVETMKEIKTKCKNDEPLVPNDTLVPNDSVTEADASRKAEICKVLLSTK